MGKVATMGEVVVTVVGDVGMKEEKEIVLDLG